MILVQRVDVFQYLKVINKKIHVSLCHYLYNAYHVTFSRVLTSWEKWFLSNCCDQCCVCLFLILSLRCIIFMILHILLFVYSSIFVLSVRNPLWVVECVSKAYLLITFDNWYFDSCICAPFSDFSLLLLPIHVIIMLT